MRSPSSRLPATLLLSGLLMLGMPGSSAWAQTTPAPAAAASLPAGVKFVTEAEGIREYRLNNGLRVLLFPDTSATTFTLNVTYLVGSRDRKSVV